MNTIKRFILSFFCVSEIKMKWQGGELGNSVYTIEEAIFQLDHFSSYEYAEVVNGFFVGWKIK